MYRHVGIVRRSDSGVDAAGEVGEIALVGVSFDIVVTAVRSASDTLKVIKWRIGRFGAVTRLDDSGSDAGEASHISAAVNGDLLVTAVRSGSDNLKLIAWDVGLGVLERLGDSGSLAGEADLIEIVSLTPTLFLTACRAGNDSLKLISWQVDPGTGVFTRLADSGSQAGAVSAVSTAVGILKLIAWQIDTDGAVTRLGDTGNGQAGKASLITTTTSGYQTARVVTAVRSASDDLVLVTWDDQPVNGEI